MILFSCKNEEEFFAAKRSIDFPFYDGTEIFDQLGRQLILRGMNTSGEAKSNEDHLPYINEEDVEKEIEYGFNVVRYMVFWEGFEPEQGQFNDWYLKETAKRIQWYTDRKIYVIIDMHQDNFASYFNQFQEAPFGGNCCVGAPDWAVITNGQPHLNVVTDLPISLDLLISPDFSRSWVNFWKYNLYPELQDSYIEVWRKVVERFKDNPYVLGYELMNEPGTGDGLDYFSGDFEKYHLKPLYNRLTNVIRAIDRDKYIVINPSAFPSNQGGVSKLPIIKDEVDNKQIFATHCYPREQFGGIDGWFKEVNNQQKRRNTPVLIGEGKAAPAHIGFNKEKVFEWFFNSMDSLQYHWTHWSNTIETEGLIFMQPSNNAFNPDRTEKGWFKSLIRTYPRTTAGKIVNFKYDHHSKDFELIFINNSSISEPTEIFIPKRHYPNGWKFNVEGVKDYTTSFDEYRNVLSFNSKENGVEIKIRIVSK